MNMYEQTLKNVIRRYLQYFEKVFNYSPKNSIQEILSADFGKKLLDSQLVVLNHEKLLHNYEYIVETETVYEFLAILSFIPKMQLENEAIFNLLYLFHFQNSNDNQIIHIYKGIINNLKNQFQIYYPAINSFIEKSINTLPFELILKEFLININPKITTIQLIQELGSFLRNYNSKLIDILTIRSTLRKNSSLAKFFDNQKKKSEKMLNVANYSSNPYLFVMLALHYENIGLKTLFVTVHISDNVNKKLKFINSYFKSIPFFTLFYYSDCNHYFNFYAIIPKDAIKHIENYLTNLNILGYIYNFQLYEHIETIQIIQFNKKISGKTLMSSIFPFKSIKFKKKVSPRRTSTFNENIMPYSEKIAYLDVFSNSERFSLNPLQLYLFFNSRNYFLNIWNFPSKKEFLQYVQKNLSNCRFSELIRRYPKIDHFEKHYNSLKNDGFNKSKIIADNRNPNRNNVRFLDFIELLDLKDKLRHSNIHFTEEFLPMWKDLNNHFKFKRQISLDYLNSSFSFLLSKNFIQESKIIATASLLKGERSIIPISLLSSREKNWINEIFFYYAKNTFREFGIKSNKLIKEVCFVDVSHSILFLKWILHQNLISLSVVYEQIFKRIDPIIITYYDYPNNRWNPKFFQMDHLIEKAGREKEKFLTQTVVTQPFSLPKNINPATFNYKHFYQDLKKITQLNEINMRISLLDKNFLPFLQEMFTSKRIHFSSMDEEILRIDKETISHSFCPEMAINPRYTSQKRVMIILSQYDADLSPFLFEKDPLLRGFFFKAVNTYFFGGQYDSIMLLECIIDETDIMEDESQWNRFLGSVARNYPTLQIRIFEIHQEEHFFNKEILFTTNWRQMEYLHLSPSKKAFEVDENVVTLSYEFKPLEISDSHQALLTKYKQNIPLTESENQILVQSNTIYHPHFFKWQFWQISGYAFALNLIITNPGKKGPKILRLLHQLPIGKIYHLKGITDAEEKWCVFLHLRESIPIFLQKFTSLLDSMRVTYTLSPVIPLDIYTRTMFPRLFALARTRKPLKFKDGDLIEIPFYPLRRSIETFSLEEFCIIGETLDRFHAQISGTISKNKWKMILREISRLWEAREITTDTVVRIFQELI